MAPLLLKVVLDGGVTVETTFESSDTVQQATQVFNGTILLPNREKEYAFFLRSADNDLSGIWLDDSRTLDYYMLRDGDALDYIRSIKKDQTSDGKSVSPETQAENKTDIEIAPKDLPVLMKLSQESNGNTSGSAADVAESLTTGTIKMIAAPHISEMDTSKTSAVAEETPKSTSQLLTFTLNPNVEDKQLMKKNPPKLEDHDRTRNEYHQTRRPSLRKWTSQFVKRALSSKNSDELNAQKLEKLAMRHPITHEDGAKLQQYLCQRLAELYAAVAVFDGTKIDTAAVMKVKELMRLIARDARTLSSRMGTEEQVALLEQIRDLCDASNKIYDYVNNVKVLIPIQDVSCSNELLSAVIQLHNASALLESYLLPSKQHNKLLSNKQLLKKSLEKLVEACNSLKAELPEKRFSRLLASSVAHAKENLAATRRLLDEPLVFQLLKEKDRDSVQQHLYRRLAQLSASVASLNFSVNAVGGIRNYTEAIKNINVVKDLTLLVVKDAKTLCAATIGPQPSSLQQLIVKLCDSCSDICGNVENPQGLTEAAERFHLTSQKLVSCTNTSPNLNKVTHITTLTVTAHKQASLIASKLQGAAEHMDSPAATLLLNKGAAIVDTANRLKAIAQILAPVLKDVNSSHELLCAVTALRQVSTLPDRSKLPKQEHQKLISYQQQLRNSLEQLVIACYIDHSDNTQNVLKNNEKEEQENQTEESKSVPTKILKENLNKMPHIIMSELQNKIVKDNKDDVILEEDEIVQRKIINNAIEINDSMNTDAMNPQQIANYKTEYPATPELELKENQIKMPCFVMSELQNKLKTGIKLDTVNVMQSRLAPVTNVNESNNQEIPQQPENADKGTLQTKQDDKLSPKRNRDKIPHSLMMELHSKIKTESTDVDEPKKEIGLQKNAHKVNDLVTDEKLNQVSKDNVNLQIMIDMEATMKENQEKMPVVIMSELKKKLKIAPPVPTRGFSGAKLIISPSEQDHSNKSPPIPLKPVRNNTLITKPINSNTIKSDTKIEPTVVTIKNNLDPVKLNTETTSNVIIVKTDIDSVKAGEKNMNLDTSTDSIIPEVIKKDTFKINTESEPIDIDQAKSREDNINLNTTEDTPGFITKDTVQFNKDIEFNIKTVKTNVDKINSGEDNMKYKTIIKLGTPDSDAGESNLEPYNPGSKPNNFNIEQLIADKLDKADNVLTIKDEEIQPQLPGNPVIISTEFNGKLKEDSAGKAEEEKIEKLEKVVKIAEEHLQSAKNALQELVSSASHPVCKTSSETSSPSASPVLQAKQLRGKLQQLDQLLQVVQRDERGEQERETQEISPPNDETKVQNSLVKRDKMKTALYELQSSLLQSRVNRNGGMDSGK